MITSFPEAKNCLYPSHFSKLKRRLYICIPLSMDQTEILLVTCGKSKHARVLSYESLLATTVESKEAKEYEMVNSSNKLKQNVYKVF